jgi:hypothetical protein
MHGPGSGEISHGQRADADRGSAIHQAGRDIVNIYHIDSGGGRDGVDPGISVTPPVSMLGQPVQDAPTC